MVAELLEHVPLEQAIDLVVSGKEICGICDFVSEQKTIENRVLFSRIKSMSGSKSKILLF